MIDNFGIFNLFGRENYEYYARISGRVLKVEENWIFAFKYPPDNVVSSEYLGACRLSIPISNRNKLSTTLSPH